MTATILTNDSFRSPRIPIFAPVLLATVLVALAVQRSGKLASYDDYRLATSLAAIGVTAYFGWRFHGIFAAVASVGLLWIADIPRTNDAAQLERSADIALVSSLVLGIGLASRAPRNGVVFWSLAIAVAAAVTTFGWLGYKSPPSDDLISRARVLHLALGTAIVSAVLGLLVRGERWRERLLATAIVLAPPAIGIFSGRSLAGAHWSDVGTEWKDWLAKGEIPDASWCWVTLWYTLPFIMVGLWRTARRSWKQAQRRDVPTALLIGLFSAFALLATTPRPVASESLLLAIIGVAVSVFGVADLALAMIERIELRPPNDDANP